MASPSKERIAGPEGSYTELTKRIDDLRTETHRGFDAVRAEMANLRAEISNLRDEGRANFRWTMSLILVNWLSLLAGIFFVAARG